MLHGIIVWDNQMMNVVLLLPWLYYDYYFDVHQDSMPDRMRWVPPYVDHHLDAFQAVIGVLIHDRNDIPRRGVRVCYVMWNVMDDWYDFVGFVDSGMMVSLFVFVMRSRHY